GPNAMHATLPATRRLAVMAFLVASCVGSAHAALYKWTDANGHVVYSDQPPPGEVKTEVLNAPPPPANPNAAKEMVQKDADFKKRQIERADAANKTTKDRALAAQRAESCKQVKLQLMQLDDSKLVLQRLNDKGERDVMDAAGRARERANLEGYTKEKYKVYR